MAPTRAELVDIYADPAGAGVIAVRVVGRTDGTQPIVAI